MNSAMQKALGADWHRLPPALQTHYRDGTTVETGYLDIEYPTIMQPVVWLLAWIGALVHRRGRRVETSVEKQVTGERQVWRRTLRFADGQVIRFNSVWVPAPDGHVIEFVNPVLGLELAPYVVDQRLHYKGVRFVARFGAVQLTFPEWLVLGHTSIVEEAVDETHFAMDFRMTHPWFGQLFRYAGLFKVDVERRD